MLKFSGWVFDFNRGVIGDDKPGDRLKVFEQFLELFSLERFAFRKLEVHFRAPMKVTRNEVHGDSAFKGEAASVCCTLTRGDVELLGLLSYFSRRFLLFFMLARRLPLSQWAGSFLRNWSFHEYISPSTSSRGVSRVISLPCHSLRTGRRGFPSLWSAAMECARYLW